MYNGYCVESVNTKLPKKATFMFLAEQLKNLESPQYDFQTECFAISNIFVTHSVVCFYTSQFVQIPHLIDYYVSNCNLIHLADTLADVHYVLS